VAHDAYEGFLDQREKSPLKPLFGESPRCSYDELVSLVAYPYGVLEPSLIIGSVDLDLESAFGGLPDVLGRLSAIGCGRKMIAHVVESTIAPVEKFESLSSGRRLPRICVRVFL